MDLGFPPLDIKNLIESNPLKARFLVRGWAAAVTDCTATTNNAINKHNTINQPYI